MLDPKNKLNNPEQKSQEQKNKSMSPSGNKAIQRPKTLICYICGKEYGTASLEIHLKSCKQKWEIEEGKKPKKQRRPVPQPPKNFDEILSGGGGNQSDQLNAYNEDAFKNYNEKALEPCPNCGRTFLPDRLTVHLKSCNKAHGIKDDVKGKTMQTPQKQMDKPELNQSPNKTIKRPKTIVCYICGREYGTTSLEIHLKSCKQKWEIEQSKKPKNQRKPLPQPPKNFDEILCGGGGGSNQDSLNSYNDEAFKNYNDKVLDPCPNCGRTFLPDRLTVHMKSCNKGGKSPNRKINNQNQEETKQPMQKSPAVIKKPKTLMCYICGREFGTTSLEIHLKSCKQKWEIEENKKPKNQRRPIPEPPKSFEEVKIGGGKQQNLDEYNQAAYENYNDKALEACHNCGRTFLPDRLVIHLRSCNKAQVKKKEQV